MKVEWRELALPDFGVPDEQPLIPDQVYEERCRRAVEAAALDWLLVYGDREHFANLTYLTGFDPRFEEALLLLSSDGGKLLLTGNEGLGYLSMVRPRLEVALLQTFSLMGQDRSQAPSLPEALRTAGIKPGQRVGVVGWKYLEPVEWQEQQAGIFAPAMLVDALRALVGDQQGVLDATWVLMHPERGLRAHNEVEQIAAFEWAGARAGAAVWRIIRAARPGSREMEIVAAMGYAGEPLSAHIMFASGKGEIVGLRSPSARRVEYGDGATTAVGYWGGLAARAGLVAAENEEFLRRAAIPYFTGLATWYETIGVGVDGATVYAAVSDTLVRDGLRSLLNPGHLVSLDEWVHTPMRPGSGEQLRSGMALQCDIIPGPLPPGWALNCEDSLALADESLRGQLQEAYPAIWARIAERRRFMREQLGIQIRDEVLPLSSTPAFLPPLWLAAHRALALA